MPRFHFAGFSAPNYTQVPDEFFDFLAPQLTEAELRVLLYIIRRTYGFKKFADDISLNQLVSGITTKDGTVLDTGTGMHRKSVIRAIKGLVENGVIEAVRNQSPKRGYEATTYRLHFASSPLALSDTRGSDPKRQALVSEGALQETDVQQTVEQETDFETRNSKSTQSGNASRAHDAPEPPAREGHRMSLEERAAWEERMDAQDSYLRKLRQSHYE